MDARRSQPVKSGTSLSGFSKRTKRSVLVLFRETLSYHQALPLSQRRVTPKPDEDVVLKRLSEELRRTHNLTDEQKQTLSKVFDKRLPPALALVGAGSVTSYRFEPSGRTIWIVRGRKGDYQVMPESMFCTCDDYYFRVMDNKKQLCYHLLAQQIAEALGKFDSSDQSDSRYAEFTAKWSARGSSRRI
jgi:predicted nucleic acid-binding Zn finger protein